MLALTDVSLVYSGGEHALREVSFSINAGEAVALCGANGSGKTSLLKLASGLLAQTSGRITLAGEPLEGKRRREAFRHVGLLFQDSEDQLFCSTVGEDVAYGPKNLGLAQQEIHERVREALEIMKIAHLVSRPIHHLSGGEKKRVALAGLLAMRTRMLVLDEPTNGLDPAGARGLIAMLQMLNQEYGHTLLVATHEMDRIPEFASRVLILRDGMLFRDGRVDEVLTDIPALEAVGLDAPIITRYFYGRKATGSGRTLPLTLAEALQAEERETV